MYWSSGFLMEAFKGAVDTSGDEFYLNTIKMQFIRHVSFTYM